jgi:hypothetical protein
VPISFVVSDKLWIWNFPEVVLSVLLSSFKISPSEKVISWQMSGIAGPAVEGPGGVRQQLPLIMSRID